MNTVLPANATPLELALTDSADVLTRLGPDADHIARFKSVPGDPLLPFLIWEYGLGELQPYIIDARELIRQGLLWQRLRGTPAAVRMALSWINIQTELEESGRGTNWPVYQLFLKGMDDIEAVRHVRKLATLSHPVRCREPRLAVVWAASITSCSTTASSSGANAPIGRTTVTVPCSASYNPLRLWYTLAHQ